MKYSLMSLMLNDEFKLTRPNFILKNIAASVGYDGDPDSVEDIYSFINKKGIPLHNGTMTFEDYIRFASENGFDSVDMMSFHFLEAGDNAAEILKKYNMVLSAVNVVVPFANATTQEKFDTLYQEAVEVIDKAKAAGCPRVLVNPNVYFTEDGITREQAFWNMVKGMRACVEYGNSKGMIISVETIESVAVPQGSISEMLRLFTEVPGLMYTHDTGNPLVAGEDPAEMYEKFKDKVVTVHFKDLAYGDEKTEMLSTKGKYLQRAHFGEGEVDFKEELQLLKRDHYDGYITLEGTLPAENDFESAKKTLAYFREMETAV